MRRSIVSPKLALARLVAVSAVVGGASAAQTVTTLPRCSTRSRTRDRTWTRPGRPSEACFRAPPRPCGEGPPWPRPWLRRCRVTIYARPAPALAALREAAYGPSHALANGATVRVAPDGGGLESVIRNVFISTLSSYPYVNGLPDHNRAPNFGQSVQMPIHRRIQTVVIRLR